MLLGLLPFALHGSRKASAEKRVLRADGQRLGFGVWVPVGFSSSLSWAVLGERPRSTLSRRSQPGLETDLCDMSTPWFHLFPRFHPCSLLGLPRMGAPSGSCPRPVSLRQVHEMEQVKCRKRATDVCFSQVCAFPLQKLHSPHRFSLLVPKNSTFSIHIGGLHKRSSSYL